MADRLVPYDAELRRYHEIGDDRPIPGPAPAGPRTRFVDGVYYLEAEQLRRLERVAVRLDDVHSLSWDDRRNLANLINLTMMEVQKVNE